MPDITDALKLQKTDAASREGALPANGLIFFTAHYAEQFLHSGKDFTHATDAKKELLIA